MNQIKINENDNDKENNMFIEDENVFQEINAEAKNQNDINNNKYKKKDQNIQDLIKNLAIEDEEMNFLFQKLDKNLKHPFFNLLNFFRIEHLESLDNEKVLNQEHNASISSFLNELQNLAYKRFMDCFQSYYEKYNLKERLKINSKLIMLKIILDTMNINPEEFINKVKMYEENENKEFSITSIIKKLSKEKIKSLKSYKEKLSLELENLQKLNS